MPTFPSAALMSAYPRLLHVAAVHMLNLDSAAAQPPQPAAWMGPGPRIECYWALPRAWVGANPRRLPANLESRLHLERAGAALLTRVAANARTGYNV